ncbi:2-hydroxyacid dehydrogenase [Ectothiorhodospiraceae bacterium 2226]|nr:2-hydroxyacid dehydrogenase [Ectothiorhodospiraceae bacterium 2226]
MVTEGTSGPAERGVFLDLGSVDAGDLDLAALRAALPQWDLHAATAPDALAARLAAAEVVVTNKTVLDGAALAAAPRLRLVCVAATGTNNVDLDAARARGIAVSNVRAYATPSVVQHVFALMFALATRLIDYRAAVRAGAWARAAHFALLDYPVQELAGRTLGIVGYGELGRAVAHAAEAFGMRVRVAQSLEGAAQAGRVPLDELLADVDVLSLHCPLTPRTRGLIGAAQLARMRPHALLINTARGGIVDEAALADALRAGRLGGAGVDTLSSEPPRAGNPLLAADIPNLIVTPHTAWASRASRQRLLDDVARNIVAWRRGQARNRVA